MDLIKRLKLIFHLTLSSLFINIFIIILIIVSWIIFAMSPLDSFLSILSLILINISLFLFAIPFVLNIISAVFMLSTDWKNDDVNNSKIIWGIFTIIILGWISSLVFYLISKNKIKHNGINYELRSEIE